MNYLHSVQLAFNCLTLRRKISLSLTIAVIIITTTLLCWWVLSPSYAVLFTQLDEQDAQHILSQLEQDNISYQLRHGGSDILIDKELIAKTRLKIMGSGMPLAGNVGFELFDKNDFGMTDFSQKINYQRALQGELERTIASFDEIRQARVHLVLPENHLFAEENNQPSAAITLHLKHPLSPKQVQSIQQLVSASVAHLRVKKVVVVDQNGNTLSPNEEDNTYNQLSTKKTIEHYLNNKVSQILYKIFNNQQVMVKIDVAINYDELKRELIKPQTEGIVTHEKKTEHATKDKTAKNKDQKDISLEKSYQFGSEKELFTRARGTIEHLSISVVLPQNTNPKMIAQIKRLVQNAIGFNEQRGDLISIEALISEPAVTSPPKMQIQTDNTAPQTDKRFSVSVYYAAFFLCFIGTTTVLIRQSRIKKRQALLIELTHWLHHHD